MTGTKLQPESLLPRSWPTVARTAVLHAISLAATALTVARDRALESRRAALRQAAEVDVLRNEIALLREELRLKDGRMAGSSRPGARTTSRWIGWPSSS